MVDAQASLQHAAQGTASAAPAPAGSTSTSGMLEERRDTLAMAGGRRAVVIIQDYSGGPAPPAPPPFRPGRGKYPSDYPGDDAGQDLDPADAHDPADLEPMEPGQPALPSVATLCNSAIGAGMLSLPFAFSKAGVWGGGERFAGGPLLPTLQRPSTPGPMLRGPSLRSGRFPTTPTLWSGPGPGFEPECSSFLSLWLGPGQGQRLQAPARAVAASLWPQQGPGQGQGRGWVAALRHWLRQSLGQGQVTGQGTGQGQAEVQTPWQAVATMCACSIGAGMLSLPYAFAQTGAFWRVCCWLGVWEGGLLRAAKGHQVQRHLQCQAHATLCP